MADRANEIAGVKVRLEELRRALEQLCADQDLTEEESTLLALGIRRDILILEIRLREVILGDR
jgi:hypothetical protein